jgi:hypothetical protein
VHDVIVMKKAAVSDEDSIAYLFEGLYARVARRMRCEPSYVCQVALGARRSKRIERALERELKRVARPELKHPRRRVVHFSGFAV